MLRFPIGTSDFSLVNYWATWDDVDNAETVQGTPGDMGCENQKKRGGELIMCPMICSLPWDDVLQRSLVCS